MRLIDLFESKPVVPSDIIARILKDPRLARGVKIPASAKLWRGVSDQSGHGMASYGQGLYFTCDKKTASEYGKVIELDASVLPTNCVRFRTVNDFQIWFQTAYTLMGFTDQRDVWKQYAGMDDFIRAIDPDCDGIQVFTGKDAMFCRYPS